MVAGGQRHAIVGAGEVGRALGQVLSRAYEVHLKDMEDRVVPLPVDTMHVALNYHGMGHLDWLSTVKKYLELYLPAPRAYSDPTPATPRPGACTQTWRRA